MITEFTSKDQFVQSLSIYEIRGLARALGVNSPTTKVREKLVDEIMEIISSGRAVPVQPTKKGRPSKELANMGMILEMLLGGKKQPSSFDKLAVFNQDVPVFSTKSSNLERMSGIVKLGGTFVYFEDLKTSAKVFIDEDVCARMQLFNGDFVEVEATKINEKQYSAKSIISLNFEPYVSGQQREKIQIEKVLPSQFMGYEGGSVLLGGRNVLKIDSPLFICNDLKNLLDYLNRQKSCNIFIGFNMCYEDEFSLSQYKNIVPITTAYENDNGSAAEKLIDAINMIANLNSLGKNVCIVAYDFATMLRELDKCYSAKQSPAPETMVLVKKLISLAGKYSSGQSTTLTVSYCGSDADSEVIRHELLRISNDMSKII